MTTTRIETGQRMSRIVKHNCVAYLCGQTSGAPTVPDTPPPMNLHDLIKDQNLSPNLIGHIDELLALKSKTKEMGRGSRIAIIDDFIEDQMAWATVVTKNEDRRDLTIKGDNLLRYIIREYAKA